MKIRIFFCNLGGTAGKIDKIKFIVKIHESVYRTSLQLQIEDYINSTSIKQLGGK